MKKETQSNEGISLTGYIFLGILVLIAGLSIGAFLSLYIISIKAPDRLNVPKQITVLENTLKSTKSIKQEESKTTEKEPVVETEQEIIEKEEKEDKVDKAYAEHQLRVMFAETKQSIQTFELSFSDGLKEETTFIRHMLKPKRLKDLGNFKITAYCPCEICCDQWADGLTFTETIALPNHTISVDPEIIPLGSKVLIDGKEYVAEDIGGAIKGNIIDMFFASHEETIQYGVQYHEVYLIEE